MFTEKGITLQLAAASNALGDKGVVVVVGWRQHIRLDLAPVENWVKNNKFWFENRNLGQKSTYW